VARAAITTTCPVCTAAFEQSGATKTCSRTCGSRRSQARAAGIDIEVPGAVTAWYEAKAEAGQVAERARAAKRAAKRVDPEQDDGDELAGGHSYRVHDYERSRFMSEPLISRCGQCGFSVCAPAAEAIDTMRAHMQEHALDREAVLV
jgi:hypothetical protein